MPEESLKRRLIERANVQAGQRVQDLGCGTGTLAVMINQAVPGAEITGLDADEQVLSIANSKAEKAHLNIKWDHGFAYDLPYPDNSFDVVVSSLVTHHLTGIDKVRSFKEVYRILRPAGRFYIVDFGRPFSAITRLQAAVLKKFEEVADNVAGHIVPMLVEAGFKSAKEAKRQATIFGPVWFYQAQKLKE
jgi:ubiquinone/menaquinone biosynthesis C-methylase UbiE